MIFMLCTVYLITGAMCHEVNRNDEYETSPNVTTLYPVKDFVHTKEYNASDNLTVTTDIENINVPKCEEKATGQSRENNKSNESSTEYEKSFQDEKDDPYDTMTIQDDIQNGTDLNNNDHGKGKPKTPKLDTSNWKIDTSFTPSKLKEQEANKNVTENKTLQDNGKKIYSDKVKEFKPSPLLGHFYSEDAFVVPTQATTGSFTPVNKNPPSFLSSPGNFYKLNYKPPNYADPIDPLYKFEHTVPSKGKEWKYSTGIEAKPPVEAPAKIPAGGLYKLPDAFKEKPSTDGDDDNFGLDFKDDEKDVKENPNKKRGNPWKSLLHLMTALVPVGIILSALTPQLITLENVDNNHHYPNRFSRRWGDGDADGDEDAVPPISESCKRRLLCELHSDSNYSTQSPRRQKHCYKIQCDDPQALGKVLNWLLRHNRARGHRPDDHGKRGYIT